MLNKILLSSCIFALTCSAQAEEVSLGHNDLSLNANLQRIDDQPLSGRVMLITHGTLAHNGMEIIASLQELLADEELPSLAINLNLGITERKGMYDCSVPHNHKHTDAVDEIGLWQNWLLENGAEEIILIGHSRGGNQTAWFSQTTSQKPLAQVLIAPATWNEQQASANYQQRYNAPLDATLATAYKLKPDHWMDNTGFIYCADAKVTAQSFISYYQPDPMFDTPRLLNNSQTPSLVFIGSEDQTVANLESGMMQVKNDKVQSIIIEGADHYFRDLYADEVVEGIVEFMETL